MNNNNDNNSQVLYLLYENLSQNRWTIPQAIAVMRLYNFNRELQQTIINIAARRVTQIERLMRWMDLSEYRLVAPNNQLITRSQNDRPERQSIVLPRKEGLNGLQAPQESIVVESITRCWSDGFLRTFVRQRDNSNWEMNISLGEMNLVWDGFNENLHNMQEIRNALRTQRMGNPNEAPY